MSNLLTRGKIIVKCSFKTVEKDGKKNTFPTYTTVMNKGKKYTVKFTTDCTDKMKDFVKIADGESYTLKRPVYSYDNRTIYSTVWVRDIESAEIFKPENEIVEETDE